MANGADRLLARSLPGIINDTAHLPAHSFPSLLLNSFRFVSPLTRTYILTHLPTYLPTLRETIICVDRKILSRGKIALTTARASPGNVVAREGDDELVLSSSGS